MKKYFHRKLVRDRIPEIIEAAGDSYKARILGAREYRKLLRKKLVEEAKELEGASKTRLLNELVDVLELVKSIGEYEGIPFQNIEKERKNKQKKAGGYKKKIFLIWSNKPAGK